MDRSENLARILLASIPREWDTLRTELESFVQDAESERDREHAERVERQKTEHVIRDEIRSMYLKHLGREPKRSELAHLKKLVRKYSS